MRSRQYKEAIEVRKTEETPDSSGKSGPDRIWWRLVHRSCFEKDDPDPPGNWQVDKERVVRSKAYEYSGPARCRICNEELEFDK